MTNPLSKLKGIRLSNNERLRMREHLALYADMNPAFDAEGAALPERGLFAFFSSRRFSLYAGALVALLVLGSGVTLAAEGSAPGDSLYALKVNVDEPVMTVLAATPTAQAKVAANIASRRIDEAVVLARRGTLTPERQMYLTTEFGKRVKIATEKADALAANGDASGSDTVKADFAASLAGEAQALGAVSTDDTGASGLLETVVATSEGISDGASSVAITQTINDSGSNTEVSTTGDATVVATTFAKNAATTTVRTLKASGKFTRLHFNASTTLHAAAKLNAASLFTPRIDIANPKPAEPESPSSLTGGVDLGN